LAPLDMREMLASLRPTARASTELLSPSSAAERSVALVSTALAADAVSAAGMGTVARMAFVSILLMQF
jgi:hypothetical protein